MPLINGKEIVYDEKQSIAIQKQINALDDLKSDLKSEVEPSKEIADINFGSGFTLFEKEDSKYVDRKERCEYFREMDTMEFVHRGLEIVADDGSQANTDGNVLTIYSDDDENKTNLEDLFINTFDMNNELWSIIYETCKIGDNFYEVVVNDYKKPKNIVFLRYLEPDKVHRVEKNGRLIYYSYKTKKEEDKPAGGIANAEEIEYRLLPWQIIHFKLESKEFAPYGMSLLYSGIKTYRRLSLLEDVMLIYRISRAPERRVFYIDVGNLNKLEARRFLEKIKTNYRTQPFINEDGSISKRAHVLSVTSDIFVPVREGQQGTKIETLQGGEALHNIDDMKYFRDKILRIMNIPPAYLGEQADRSRGGLAAQDIKFSRFIERIQAQITKGLNKIAALQLFFNGVKKDELNNFKIEFTPPSNIKEITEIDVVNQKMTLIATIQSLNLFSNQWILKSILKMSDKEIADIMLYKKIEVEEQPPAEGEGIGGVPGVEMSATPEAEGVPPEETPPEAEGVPPEETPPAPEEIAASVAIKNLGKDFILENQTDFFRLIKHIKEQNGKNKKTKLSIAESLSKALAGEEKIVLGKSNIKRLFTINEFGGIHFKEHKVDLFESYKDKEGNTNFKIIKG